MIQFKKSYIPNCISVFRLFLIPVFLYFYFIRCSVVHSVTTFLLAGLSDVIDGALARKNGWTSNVGRVLDPLADKSMQITVLVSLSIDGIIPWIITAILIAKEIVLLAGATCLIKKFHFYVQSGWYGKGAVVLFYAVVVSMMIAKNMTNTLKIVLSVLLIVAMLFALIMYYLKVFIKKNIKTKDLSIK